MSECTRRGNIVTVDVSTDIKNIKEAVNGYFGTSKIIVQYTCAEAEFKQRVRVDKLMNGLGIKYTYRTTGD